ncbi:hypothetical protein E2P81_ATG11614 [Venturia nashicola]|uniref:SWR1-complex protein 3 domain-containing protein n=1 Tax=Venturia nashicola TaxID=86259 RepID=A0A4Z1ND57_9PEZI|nr:hypothetical protein E6O75_ATG11308 [Venturia nashicola]TLD18704.1 hypothetical protein E2P81_ATG11614 [Venturia nashicola]
MVAERRQSSRIKAELPEKRRLSEIEAEKAAPPRKRQRTPSKVEQPSNSAGTLPTKVADGRPLPTLKTPQPSDLLDTEYQSVLDSGVLLASFTRSRQIWTHGTLLEKFWSKTKAPSAKKIKEMTEEEKAAHKAAKGPAMSKIGSATITIEPHAFEVTLFVVKDTTPGIKQGQLPPERQFQQYHAPQPSLAPAYRPPQQQYHPPTLAHTVQYQTPSQPPRPVPAPPVRPPQNVPSAPAPAAPRSQGSNAIPSPAPAPVAAPPKPNPGPDPVIKALAARAATDPELKKVMKVVAQGNASSSELEYFQQHIKELTEQFEKERDEKEKWKPHSTVKPPVPAAPRPPVQNNTAYPVNGMAPRPPNIPYTHPNPQPPRPRIVSTPAPLQILIQFGENANDRYSIPKNSILEFLPGNSLLCSFVVVKTGAEAVDKNGLDLKLEYWQPVTMKISAESHILDMIGRVVATADESRAYMGRVIERCKRADELNLAFRLPKVSAEGEGSLMSR